MIVYLYSFFSVPVRKKGIMRYLFPSFTNSSSYNPTSNVSSVSNPSSSSKTQNNDFYIGKFEQNIFGFFLICFFVYIVIIFSNLIKFKIIHNKCRQRIRRMIVFLINLQYLYFFMKSFAYIFNQKHYILMIYFQYKTI